MRTIRFREGAPELTEEDVFGSSSSVEADPVIRAPSNELGDPDDLLADIPLDESPKITAQPPTPAQTNDDDDDEYKLADEFSIAKDDDDVEEAILLDDDEELVEVDSADDSPPSASGPPPVPAPPVAAPPIDEPDPVLDDILGDAVDLNAGAEERRLRTRKRGISGLISDLFGGGRHRPRKNRWDSPLILLGGGGLILLLTAGVGFYALFMSENADEVFNAGQDAYESQSYTLAIKNFDNFQSRFRTDPRASLARVRIGMSKLRQTTDMGSPKWEEALSTAQTMLPGIKTEEGFTDARNELAKLLPDISSGLVESAKSAVNTGEKERLIALANDAMGLVDNPEYLPTSVRQPQEIRIEEIQSNIEVVTRNIQREVALATTVEQIKTAAGSGKITEAYQLRDQLVTAYPLLTDDATLLNTLGAVTEKERDAVQVEPGTEKAATDDHASDARFQVVLSDQRGKPIQGVDGMVIGSLVRGAVYGLNASDGKAIWRRHVGYQAAVFPQTVDRTLGSDFLIVDTSHGEVQRVAAQTGKLIWRLPCPQPIATPLVYGKRAFVSCGSAADSALLSIDLANGGVLAKAKFPVGCESAPGIIASRNEIVQVGTHSSGYVLDADTLKCKSVFPIGHARGSIAVPPAFVGNSIVVAENTDSSTAKIHVFAFAGDEAGWNRAGTVPVTGRVTTPMSVDDRRLLVTSEMGEIKALESPAEGTGLRNVAQISASDENLGPAYALLTRSGIWVANAALGRFELQATRGQLVSKWTRDRNDHFLNPLQRQGSYLFHVRRRQGVMGATVAATRVTGAGDDGAPVWETDIGVTSSVLVNGQNEIHAVTMNGAMFPVGQETAKRGVTSDRSSRVDPRLVPRAVTQQLAIDKNLSIFAGPPPTAHVFAANLQSGELQHVPLRIGQDQVTAELANFQGALLAACEAGPIYLLDPETGRQKSNPFMPRMEPGQKLNWLRPAALEKNQFLAAETSGQLYRVALSGNQLALAKETRVDGEFAGGIAAVANTAYAVTRDGGSYSVVAIDGQNLTIGNQWPLTRGLAWGPKRIGSLVFVSDGDQGLLAFDDRGNLRWQSNQKVGPIAGDPLIVSDRVVVAATSGLISVLNAQGEVISQKKFDEPLGSGPVSFNGKLLVSGWDGTLYVLDVPQ